MKTIKQHMKKIAFLRKSGIYSLCWIYFFLVAGQADGQTQVRPNIVIILADDMGYSDIGCYGGEIKTPNLDNMAANGIRFSQFYNAARCCPTRASLLTGLYPHETGFGFMDGNMGFPGYEGYLNDHCLTIAEVLKLGGYETMMSGKWHLGHKISHQPHDRGFDRFYGTLLGACSYFDPASLMKDSTPIKAGSPGYYYTDAISDTAVQFIKGHMAGNAEDPFFLYVAYTAPHWPLHAPEEIIQKYNGFYSKGWESIRSERYKRMIEMGLIDSSWQLSPSENGIVSWENEEHKHWRERCMQVYAAQVDAMDQGIGRIVAAIENAGQQENTLIFFLSDNGGCSNDMKDTGWLVKNGLLPEKAPDGRPMRPNSDPSIMPGDADTYAAYGLPWANASNTPFRKYKTFAHEGGIATPLIAHWHGVTKKSAIIQQPAHIIDIMATCLDVAGVEYPQIYKGKQLKPLEGKSLIPLFRMEGQPIHDALYWEHIGKRAVRQGKWKLVSTNDGVWELYDLEKDRTELHDLSNDLPEKVQELEESYQNWAKKCGVQPYEVFIRARNRTQ